MGFTLAVDLCGQLAPIQQQADGGQEAEELGSHVWESLTILVWTVRPETGYNNSYFEVSSSLNLFLFPLRSFDIFILSLLFILKIFLKWPQVMHNCSLILKKEAV